MDFIKNNARTIVIALLVIGAVSALGNKKEETTSTDQGQQVTTTNDTAVTKEAEASPSSPAKDTQVIAKVDNEYSVTALKGDNQTKLVRRVIAEYLDSVNEKISGEQRLFVETNLVDALPRNDLIFVGDTVKVQETELSRLVAESKNLTANQISAWSRYL